MKTLHRSQRFKNEIFCRDFYSVLFFYGFTLKVFSHYLQIIKFYSYVLKKHWELTKNLAWYTIVIFQLSYIVTAAKNNNIIFRMNRKTEQTGFLFLTGNNFFLLPRILFCCKNLMMSFTRKKNSAILTGKNESIRRQGKEGIPLSHANDQLWKSWWRKKRMKKFFCIFLSRSMIYLLQIYCFKVRRHFSTKLTRRFKICIAFFVVFPYFKDSLTSTDFILLLKDNNAHRLW